ncbi:Protein of unknown function [Pyronema omphalodes CBS 100304]|uniref:Uncharacterized protein n=1 Tax=Pyronema omphalodes (strain CBS 100304) TaxID=1076935 RepID=U4L5U0_PYROM|nr:Protein of unknown function [Pyronema omphalodes CBS 100304]
MCRVAPEHIWPHLVAEHPVEKSWEQVKEPNFSHTEYGSFEKFSGSYNAGLVEFPGMCPICHKNDRRPKWNFGDNWEKTQDPSSGWLGFKTKTIEEEVDELADLMGAASLDRHAGWQEPEPLERRAWYWGWVSVIMGMLVTFLILAMMWEGGIWRGDSDVPGLR